MFSSMDFGDYQYKLVSAVEWDKAPVECLRNRMKTKWGIVDADELSCYN
ncbi:MAG: hypothetical protein IIY81_05175 [Lachnospiraceae bacterium]|nr:hypothetical protein [Lachnospiraceae bacterium]